jgi:hypothetical protein
MGKSTYIPKGTECRLGGLTCGNIVVNGLLCADGEIRAKRIRGKGFLRANSVLADSVTVHDISAVTVVTDEPAAKRITAKEIRATREVCVSSHIEAASVKTGKITMAGNTISELEADEVILLPSKPRGMAGTLIASFFRSKFAALFYGRPKSRDEKAKADANGAPESTGAKDAKSGTETGSTAAGNAGDAGTPAPGNSDIAAAMCALLKSVDCILRFAPKEASAENDANGDENPFFSAGDRIPPFGAAKPEDKAA